MIEFYTYPTINGQAVTIALLLLEARHKAHVIDLTQGLQRQPEFLAINPSGRIPVIVDEVAGKRMILSQTGAILIYLAEKHQKLLSEDVYQKSKILQWMQFVLTDISTNVFNNFHLKALVQPKQPVAGEILKQRAVKFCGEIDQQLSNHKYIAGDEISLVDVVAFPVVNQLHQDLSGGQCPNLIRWYQSLQRVSAFTEGLKLTT